MSINNIKLKTKRDPFFAESLRDLLAKQNKKLSFVKTYNKSFPEITDLNSPKLWDKLNERDHVYKSHSPMAAHKLDVISTFIPDEKTKVLNVACGSGDLEFVVFNLKHKNGLRWHGIDISKRSIERCKKEFENYGTFNVGDVRHISYHNDFFDVLILAEILEHILPSQTFRVLSEVNRVLKKGGRLIISVPLNEELDKLIEANRNPNAHVRTYSEDVIRFELEIAGFEIEKTIKLIAFPKFYHLKSLIAKWVLTRYRKPNCLIIIAKKK